MTVELENEHGEIYSVVHTDRRPTVRVQPLLTGDVAPFFSLTGSEPNWTASVFNQAGQRNSILDLIRHKPLVVSFYCPCWGRYARPYLDGLVKLATDVQAAGAQLVVFSNEPARALARQVDLHDFVVAYDADFSVARQFGVYSEEDPLWDRVAGISEDVFTPALYVIDANRRIQYHFLDENFENNLPHEEILEAVLNV